MLVVRGEAGIGKTALLQHLVDAAWGCRVVHATGVESEMELPFAGLHQLCATMLRGLDSLPGPQRDAASTAFGLTAGTPPDRLLIGLAILNLLAAASEDTPLLCVIDDAQWLDRESAQTLAFVARRILADRLGIVFATREPGAELAEFPELIVKGLSKGDAQTLLSAIHHIPLDERVRSRIVAETHGNPLALVEWSRGLTPAELAGGLGLPPLLSLSGQIEEHFRRRLAELPEPTQRFLTVAAAEPTGDPIIVWRAAAALGIDPNDAMPAVDADLVEISVRVWFRHPLVRSATYSAASFADRQRAHRALADATDPEIDPVRRAWHRALGSTGPDEAIAVELEQSARRARARGGLAAAAALLERSVAFTEDPSRSGPRMLAAAANHQSAGSFDAAARWLTAAEAAPLDDLRRVQLDMLRGRYASTGGDARGASELLLRAARRLEPLDLGAAFDTYLQAMGAAMLAGNFANGARSREIARAVQRCPSSSEPTMIESLVVALAQAAVDGTAAAASSLRRVLDTTATDAVATVPFYGFAYLGAAATLLWDFDVNNRLTAMHVAATREIGALTMLPWALNTVALLLTLEGELDRAASMIGEAEQIVDATGGNIGMAWSRAVLAGWRADGESLQLIDEVAEPGRAAGNAQALKHALWGRAILHNGMGQYERAVAAGAEALQHPADWGTHMFFHEHIEAAVRSGQPRAGAATLELLRDATAGCDSGWAVGLLRRSEAVLADGTAAEGLYREAIDRLDGTRLRPEAARARLLYGEWLRRQDRRVDARNELRRANEMLTDIGTLAFAQRARRELLATGETIRRRTADAYNELTAQEAHIAQLAADGRTNPEIGEQLFISPRTVEWHLGKVFTKLDVTSRKELRGALSRQARALRG